MPKLHSTNFEGMELIRPLYLVREDDIKAWRDYNGLHFIQCACKFTDTCTTCNNEENRSKRVEIKELIKKLKEVNQYVEGNIFKSVENVNLETVVAYKKERARVIEELKNETRTIIISFGHEKSYLITLHERCMSVLLSSRS